MTIASALGLIDDDVEMDDDEDEDEDNDVGMDADGDVDEFKATHVAQQTAALKQDFLEVVAADWRPGLIRFGSNEFGELVLARHRIDDRLTHHSIVVSVSCPVVKVCIPFYSTHQ